MESARQQEKLFYKCATGYYTPVIHRGSPTDREMLGVSPALLLLHPQRGQVASKAKKGVWGGGARMGFVVLQISGMSAHRQTQSRVRRMESKVPWLWILARRKTQWLLYYSGLDSVGWSAIWERPLWQSRKCHLSPSSQKQWEGRAETRS